ncbi:MAG: hypothetical protein HY684_06245 [Chloroflexi bacterium]|nr:hypothetical protein [Chloroflexota bacterium]
MSQPTDLFWLTFWIALPMLLLAQASIVVATIKSRGQPGQTAERWPSNSKLDILWAVAPSLLVVALAVMTYHAVQAGR